MKNLKNWGKLKDKRRLLFAVYAVWDVEQNYEKNKNLHKDPTGRNKKTLPSPDKWLKYYKDSRQLEKEFFEGFTENIIMNPVYVDLFLTVLKFYSLRFSDDKILYFMELLPFIDKSERKRLLEKAKSIDFENNGWLKKRNGGNRGAAKTEINDPCIMFLTRVWLPCMELYGNYPPLLFRKARQGDVDAISKLLKLDKGVIQDSRIGHHIHKISMNAESDEFKKIARAFGSTSVVSSISRYKGMVASRIYQGFKDIGEDVTISEIQRLFDTVFSFRNPGTMIDSDLPESLEAFAKTIQRRSPNYSPLIQPDKK